MNATHHSDVLVIGSGAAGLSLALKLAEAGTQVALICKGELSGGSTFYAQGGIAGVLDPNDSVDSHIQDTLVAGAGLCNEEAVHFTVENSTESIQWLISQGVPFTENRGSKPASSKTRFHLAQEGGHSHRRIIHADDATGRAVSKTLAKNAILHPNIQHFEHRVAIDLITGHKLGLSDTGCFGAYVLDLESDHVEMFRANFVVLATGGASKVYLYTSNPDGASGDGIAMAWRAGCRVGNMEFNQFHPTCLYHPNAKSFLLSEALRGEGAKLLLPSGKRFMKKFDARGELAPRDIVARAIDHEMKRLGCDNLYLDISHEPEEFIVRHFPTIHKRCLKFGYDLTKQPIPVVPAAHYTCGGILTNLDGQTDVPHLYAIGECAFTGLHGANRLASNSILECLVFADSATKDILSKLDRPIQLPTAPDWDESQVTDSDEDVIISHNWDELRRFMWDYVGIVRTDKRLQRAEHRATLLKQEIAEYYSNYKVSNDLIELRNLVDVAELIIQSAMRRKESRGLHYTLDYPGVCETKANTILTPPNFEPSARPENEAEPVTA